MSSGFSDSLEASSFELSNLKDTFKDGLEIIDVVLFKGDIFISSSDGERLVTFSLVSPLNEDNIHPVQYLATDKSYSSLITGKPKTRAPFSVIYNTLFETIRNWAIKDPLIHFTEYIRNRVHMDVTGGHELNEFHQELSSEFGSLTETFGTSLMRLFVIVDDGEECFGSLLLIQDPGYNEHNALKMGLCVLLRAVEKPSDNYGSKFRLEATFTDVRKISMKMKQGVDYFYTRTYNSKEIEGKIHTNFYYSLSRGSTLSEVSKNFLSRF